MSNCLLRNSVLLGENHKPYIVAEVNTSHNGSVETAKKMIDAAKGAGCDCVKFQSWTAETLYSRDYYNENPISKRIVTKFSFSEEKLAEVAAYCGAVGIDFSSTPYSNAEVDFLLDKCNAPFIKIASMDINNYPFLEYIARTGAPIVLSTGMADIEEVQKAIETIEKTGNGNICLLHCISIYPPEISTIRLKNIIGLKQMFPNYAVGFSDHSLGTEMATAAVALGASLIEKHLTLDKTKIGMDNQMATEPEEMAMLVKNCHNVYMALGSETRIVQAAEKEQRLKMRRSIVAARDLKPGHILTMDDLDAKRPGTGLAPEKMFAIVGKKVLRNVEADMLLSPEDLEI